MSLSRGLWFGRRLARASRVELAMLRAQWSAHFICNSDVRAAMPTILAEPAQAVNRRAWTCARGELGQPSAPTFISEGSPLGAA
jgi:hypothetical protein